MNHSFLMPTPPPNWVELGHTHHWVVERDAARRVIRARRTSATFGPDTDWEAMAATLSRTLEIYDRASHAMLVDMREAPMRSDPEFERAMRPIQQAGTKGFARVAVLVRTAVGLLQVSRTSRQNGSGSHAFQDESEALAYLGTPRDRK